MINYIVEVKDINSTSEGRILKGNCIRARVMCGYDKAFQTAVCSNCERIGYANGIHYSIRV